jgi:hypothetical protein
MTQTQVLRNLIDNGWISLRQLGVLLRAPDRSIYGRQRTKNPIQTIRIGGIERVYPDAVKLEIQQAKTLGYGESTILLNLLATGTKQKDRENAASLCKS